MYQILRTRLRILATTVLAWHLGLAACSQDPRMEEEQMMRDENIEAASIPSEGASSGDNSQDIGWMQSNKPTEEEQAANADLPESTAEQFKEELTAINADEPSPVAEAPATEEIAAPTQNDTSASEEVVSAEEMNSEEPKQYALGEYINTTPKVEEDNPAFKEEEKVKVPEPQPAKRTKTKTASKKHAAKTHTAHAANTSTTTNHSGTMKYVVVRGDTLGKIAARIYGDSKQWRTLADLNSLPNPDRIHPGDVISFSSNNKSKQFETSYYGSKQKVVVQNGDTLQKISKRVFGKNSYWKTLWQFNAEAVKDPNHIHSEQVLYYVAPLTSRQDDGGTAGNSTY